MLVPKIRFKEFKNEWHKEKLGKTCSILMCKRIFANQTSNNYEIPFYKIGTIGTEADTCISKKLFDEYKEKYNYPRKGELLVTCAGTVGKCLVFDGKDAYFQDSNIVWIDNPTQVIKNSFLFYLMNNVNWSKLNSTTIVRIYNDNLRNLNLTFPDVQEQAKIAKFLNLLDKKIQLQQRKIETLKMYKRGLIQDQAKKSNQWNEYKISDIFDITRGVVIPKNSLKSTPDQTYRYPVYSSQTSNYGILGYDRTYDFDGNYLTWTTDGANAGKVFFRSGKFRCTNVCGVLFSANNNKFINLLTADLLNYETPKYVSYVGNPKLMNNVMGNITVKLPSIQDQEKISNLFSFINKKIEEENKYLSKLNCLKKYLLQNMFI